jgi:hypothetical protein
MAVAALVALSLFSSALPARADEPGAAARALGARRGTQSLTLPVSSKVGKSHVYVPYYGNVSTDPAHPSWQGAAGIAYGFRSWDISVVNGGFGNAPPAVPGSDIPKPNQSLTLSIRF